MKVDENSDTAFLLLVNMFLMLFAGFWSLSIVFFLIKFGFKDKKIIKPKVLIINIILNLLLWYGIYCLTVYLKEQDWMKNFDPYEVLGINSDATEREIKKAY